MYNISSDLIKNELTNSILQPIYNIFEDASIVHKELIEKEHDIFKGAYLSEFKGRLINYIIKRSFDVDRIPSKFPFKVDAVSMACGQKRTELKRNNILLTLGKTPRPFTLPRTSKYKREYSRGNSSLCKQLKIEIEEPRLSITDIPYYGIITYNIRNNELEFLNIVIPDSSFNQVVDCIPVAPSLKVIKKDYEDNNDEERVLGRDNIRKEVIDRIRKLEQELR